MAEEQPGNGGQNEQGGEEGGMLETPVSWDAWLQQQPETVRTLADAHVSGLKGALVGEREQRKALAKELKDALTKAEKGSELERALSEMSGRAETAERRAVFFEMAAQPGVNCTNAKAAFLLAQAENLFKRDGTPDWAALQQVAPELFRKAGTVNAGTANAGAGTSAPPPAQVGMNEFIRRAAGRG